MLSATSGTSTPSCHCDGCSEKNHIPHQATTTTACATACATHATCKVSLFDSQSNRAKCFLYPHEVKSIKGYPKIKYIGSLTNPKAHPYVYSSRSAALSACKQDGFSRLCSKNEGSGFERCAAGWYSNYKGYWMSKTARGCGSGRGFRGWGNGKVGAYCCGPKVAAKSQFTCWHKAGAVPNSKMLGKAGKLVKNTLVKTMNLPLDFTLEFDLTLKGTVSGWGSVFHFTTGSNCCVHGQRIPAMWFRPGSRTFIIVDGNQKNGNAHNNHGTIAIGKKVSIKMVASKKSFDTYVDGKKTGSLNRSSSDRQAWSNVKFYMADPWYPAANAVVSQMKFTEK